MDCDGMRVEYCSRLSETTFDCISRTEDHRLAALRLMLWQLREQHESRLRYCVPGNQGINDRSPITSDFVIQTKIISGLVSGSSSPGRGRLGQDDQRLE